MTGATHYRGDFGTPTAYTSTDHGTAESPRACECHDTIIIICQVYVVKKTHLRISDAIAPFLELLAITPIGAEPISQQHCTPRCSHASNRALACGFNSLARYIRCDVLSRVFVWSSPFLVRYPRYPRYAVENIDVRKKLLAVTVKYDTSFRSLASPLNFCNQLLADTAFMNVSKSSSILA